MIQTLTELLLNKYFKIKSKFTLNKIEYNDNKDRFS